MSQDESNPAISARQSAGQSFSKQVRLLKSSEFDAVYALRQSAADGMLIVNGKENELGHARLGLTVSRRVGNAVARNRWKRLLREAFRLSRQRLPALDLVVSPRPGVQPRLLEAQASLVSLAARVERRLRSGAPPYSPRRDQRGKKPPGARGKSGQPPSPPRLKGTSE